MNFDDLKDQLNEQLQVLWDKIQENSLFISLREKFEDLSPPAQKLTVIGVIAFFVIIVLSYPIGSLFTSSDYVQEFNEKRNLVTRMHRAVQQVNMGPNIPPPPPASALESQVRQRINSARLLPEQILSISLQNSASSGLIPSELIGDSIAVRLGQLNLLQIIELGRAFESIHSSVKLKDLSIQAGNNDPGYFNVNYEIVSLAVPQAAVETDEEEEPPTGSRRGR